MRVDRIFEGGTLLTRTGSNFIVAFCYPSLPLK